MYVQQLEPVAGSLGLSALVATLPLVTVLVLLGVVRLKAHLAGLTGLLAAVLVAWLAFRMPLGQTLSSAAQGAAFGLFVPPMDMIGQLNPPPRCCRGASDCCW